MREIDQVQYAVHHRVTQRDQCIHAAENQPVDDLLEKNVHRVSVFVPPLPNMNNAALPVFLLRLLLFTISIAAHYLLCLMLRSGNLSCSRCSITSTRTTAA